jgi:shikimate dehydrogenase
VLRAPPGGRFAGVLGWPLEHTLSPAIHNAAFRRAGIDCTYLAFEVPPEDLAAAVRGLRALGVYGANVTMPHKERVADLLDEVTGDAAVLRVVNTIAPLSGRLIGHNTDVAGFTAVLTDDAGYSPEGRRAVVLGAGGAARAVVKALGDLGAASIVVVARDPERATWVQEIATAAEAVSWERAQEAAAAADCVVNATPLGMEGEHPLPGADFRPGQLVYDLVYRPPATPLVESARAQGADAWGGLGMLVHQAAASFRIWTGTEAPIEAMSAAALHAIRSTRP